MKSEHDLWNGNITDMVTTIPNAPTPSVVNPALTLVPQGTAYKYDQLNRLIEMQAYQNLTATSNIWGVMGYAGMYNNQFTYDANGNIATQNRNDHTGSPIDQLTYNYYNAGGNKIQNRLYSVTDLVAAGAYPDDIDDMGSFYNSPANVNISNNYSYDEIGNLTKDSQELIANIEWTVSGKIKSIWRTDNSHKMTLYFDYDAMGNRIAKHIQFVGGIGPAYVQLAPQIDYYYIRDATGKQMAVYKNSYSIMSGQSFQLIERDMYGSSRLGTDDSVMEMISPPPPPFPGFYGRKLGFKHYEATNHLGNVLVTFTDRKLPFYVSGPSIDHWVPEVISGTDYSPFGVALDVRNFSSSSYRYGFNGKEKDDEIKPEGVGLSYDYGMRMQDPRSGRFFSVDPLFKNFAYYSTYQFTGNNPVKFVDIDGKEQAMPMVVGQNVNGEQKADVDVARGGPAGMYLQQQANAPIIPVDNRNILQQMHDISKQLDAGGGELLGNGGSDLSGDPKLDDLKNAGELVGATVGTFSGVSEAGVIGYMGAAFSTNKLIDVATGDDILKSSGEAIGYTITGDQGALFGGKLIELLDLGTSVANGFDGFQKAFEGNNVEKLVGAGNDAAGIMKSIYNIFIAPDPKPDTTTNSDTNTQPDTQQNSNTQDDDCESE